MNGTGAPCGMGSHLLRICLLHLLVLRTTSVSHAAELCQRLSNVTQGTLHLRKALEGMTIYLGTVIFEDRYLRIDPSSGNYIGFEKDLMDALARRGKFNYEFKIYTKSSTESYDDVLSRILTESDVAAFGYFRQTTERARKGFRLAYGVFDSSYRLVAKKTKKDVPLFSMESIFQCYMPFEIPVWLAFLFLTFCTGLFYLLFEKGNHDEFGSHMCENVVQSALWSFMDIASGGALQPGTWPGKLVACSWSWFAVLFLAAYTANLASFLVHKEIAISPYDTMAEAQHANAELCMDSFTYDWFRTVYPSYKKASEYEPVTFKEVFEALANGKCECGIATSMLFDEIENQRTYNPDCRLQVLVETLHRQDAGWMTKIDYSENCTRLVGDVLNTHFVELESEGTLKELTSQLSQFGADQDCSLPGGGTGRRLKASSQSLGSTAETEENTSQLTIYNMLGMIVIHCILLLLALILHFIHKLQRLATDPTPSWEKVNTKVEELMAIEKANMERSVGLCPSLGHDISEPLVVPVCEESEQAKHCSKVPPTTHTETSQNVIGVSRHCPKDVCPDPALTSARLESESRVSTSANIPSSGVTSAPYLMKYSI